MDWKNKEDMKRYHREYEKKNKEKIAKYKREYMKIPEVRERRKKYSEEYREKNKIVLSEKRRKYKQKNKDKISKQGKEYLLSPEGIKTKKEWYEKNEDKIKLKRKEFYKNNKERLDNKSIEYHKNNKEKIIKQNKKYESRLDIIQMRKDYENNPIRKKKHLKSNRLWRNKKRKEDPIFRLMLNLRGRLRMAFKHYSKSGKIRKASEYGIDYKAIIEHLKPFPEDLSNFEVDHIIPLSWFDFNNPKEIEWAFAPENHQWLTKEENREKSNKYIFVK